VGQCLCFNTWQTTAHAPATCSNGHCTNKQDNFLSFYSELWPQPYPGRALCSSSGESTLHARPPALGSSACRTLPGRRHSIRALRPCSEWTPVIIHCALIGRWKEQTGQKIEWTGRGPLRRRRSALDCSATEEEERNKRKLPSIYLQHGGYCTLTYTSGGITAGSNKQYCQIQYGPSITSPFFRIM
jgi:hypothetical protein